jgi:hypothetical protein
MAELRELIAENAHLERSELVAAVAALDDAQSFAADVAVHDPGWRDMVAASTGGRRTGHARGCSATARCRGPIGSSRPAR